MTEQPGPARPSEPHRAPRAGEVFRHCPGGAGRRSGVAVGLVLLLVLGARRRHGPGAPAAAADQRRAGVPGLERRRRGAARRARHPAAVRRLGRRPDARPGLRARAGALLRDGRAPARHRRPARRDVRRGRPRERRDGPHAWAGAGSPSRSWRCSSPRPGRRWTPTPTASTPTSTSTRPARSRWSTPLLGLGGLDYRPEDWTPGRLAGLAQGDGVGPARQPRGRDRPGPRPRRPLGAERAGPVPGVPLRRAPARSSARVPSSTASSSRTRPPAAPATRSARRSPPSGARRWPRCAAGLAGCPPCSAAATASARNSWVVDGDALGDRAPAAGQRPAPRPPRCRGCGCRWACTARRSRRTARSTSPASPSPACPGVVIGHNADIAWGFTNLGRRRHRPVARAALRRPLALRRRAGARCAPARRRSRSPAATTSTLTVRSTRHGPLLSDVSDDYADLGRTARVDGQPRTDDADYGVALQWTALHPAPTADAILALDTATDWDSFRAAASSFAVPAQNLVYADRAGHIGYQAPGRVPIRKSGNDGLVPVGGLARGERLDRRHHPLRRAAQRARPGRGVRRHRQPGRDRPGLPLPAHRRLGPRLPLAADPRPARAGGRAVGRARWPRSSSTPAARPRRCCCPTCSTCELPGRLLRRRPPGCCARWDFDQDADSGAAAYFNAVWRHVLAATFHDDLPEELWPDGGDRWVAVMDRLLADPTATWWDDADHRRHGRDPRRHPGRGDDRRPRRDDPAPGRSTRTTGTGATCTPSSSRARRSASPTSRRCAGWSTAAAGSSAAAARRSTPTVVGRRRRATAWSTCRRCGWWSSLGDLDRSRWINLTGVSGHPASGHYTDQTDLWARGETLPWAFSPGAVRAAAEDTLTLTPGG